MLTRQYTTFVPFRGDRESLSYVIVGTGMMGREHISNLLKIPAVNISALVDPTQASLDLASTLCGETQCFTELSEVLGHVETDVVVISSPNFTHEELALQAIEGGAHVLIEKPLATTVEGCVRIEREASSRPRQVVAVGLEYRFMAPTMWLLDRVAQGDLGDVRLVTIVEHRFPFLDKVGSWNRFNEYTGGTLVEKCCHFFDLMFQVVKSEPIAVVASSADRVNHVDERYGGRQPDILDNAYVIVEFDGGKRGMLELCMFAEGSRDEQRISVVGDRGKAEVCIPSHECSIGLRGAGRDGVITHIESLASPYEGLHHGSSFREHEAFRAALRGETSNIATLRDGTRSVAIGVAAQRSICEGRRVTLAEVGYV